MTSSTSRRPVPGVLAWTSPPASSSCSPTCRPAAPIRPHRTAQLRSGPGGGTLLPPAFAELITSGNVALPPSAAPTEPASQTLFYGNGHLDAIAIAQEHIDSESAAGRCADVAAKWAVRRGIPGHGVPGPPLVGECLADGPWVTMTNRAS